MDSLYKIIGREQYLEDTLRALKTAVDGYRAGLVGAVQVACSDESEKECNDAFQSSFVQNFLPHLKFSSQSAFRTANLGGRYEWGSIPIAEGHFSSSSAGVQFKLMVVKINSHVSVVRAGTGQVFGHMERYQSDSRYCGALASLLRGGDEPALAEMREAFAAEDKDRLAILRDPVLVDPAYRNLYVAVTNVRLQARHAVLDIQSHSDASPTVYIVISCVTINRKDRDTELLCGTYVADRREGGSDVEYRGLGDDPSAYTFRSDLSRFEVEDENMRQSRPARDHRKIIVGEWFKRKHDAPQQSAEVREIREQVRQGKLNDQDYAVLLGKTLLKAVANSNPVTATMLMFGEGLVGMHHIHDMNKLADETAGDATARAILASVEEQIEQLPPDKARKIVELLAQDL